VIRYADDFVVLHPDREVIRRCHQLAQEWLARPGLELKPGKTRVVAVSLRLAAFTAERLVVPGTIREAGGHAAEAEVLEAQRVRGAAGDRGLRGVTRSIDRGSGEERH
jgi:hypothetical protein